MQQYLLPLVRATEKGCKSMEHRDTTTHIHIRLDGQLSQRVDPATWAIIRPYMRYYDEELIEDIGTFGMQPGWYVTNESAVERLLHVPESLRIATLRLQAKQEEQALVKSKAREQQETAARIQRKLGEYALWKEQRLTGLETFHDWFAGFPRLLWQEIAVFDEEVGWSGTGDRWSQATWNGNVIYSKQYGNTTKYYTSRTNAVKLARAGIESLREWYPTDLDLARHILMTHDRGCIGDDSARIVVEEDGLEHYIALAKQEVWYILARDHRTDTYWQTADKYGLPYIELVRRKSIYGSGYSHQWQQAFQARLNAYFQTTYCRYTSVSYLPEENKWFVDEGHVSAPAVPAPDLSDLFPELLKEAV